MKRYLNRRRQDTKYKQSHQSGAYTCLVHRARRRRPQDQRCLPRSPSTVVKSAERENERASEIEREIERERKKELESW